MCEAVDRGQGGPSPAHGHPGPGLRRVQALLIAALLAVAQLFALEVPYLASRVNDEADLLGPEAEQRLESTLGTLERETGAQVAVLTIPSLEDEVLEDFSIRVVEQWKLGRAGVDDGVLLLVARDDRKLRIEVGYGLEGALPDVVARRIIDEIIVPELRNGDFEGGIEAGVAALAGVIRGEELPPPPARSSGGGGGGFDFVGAILVALFVMSGALSSAIRKKPMRALIVALVGALLVGAGLALFLTVIWGILGAGAWLFFVLLTYLAPASTGRSGGRGGWISGGGRFGGGGGFSGGGGSFGGGGASGSW